MRLRCGTIALLAGLLPAIAATAGSDDAWVSADDILARAIERHAEHRDAGDNVKFDYQLVSVTEKLDKKGEVEEVERELYASHHIDGNVYERLVEKDGRPLDEDELDDEREREDEFRESLADDEAEDERVAFDEELVSRYDFDRDDDEMVRGRPCYRLSFRPKPGDLPNRRRMDRVLNKAHGRVWVDAQTFEVARVRFDLDQKVSLWWGVLGSVSEMTGVLERREVADEIWLPASFELYLRGRVLFRSLHMRQSVSWNNFAPRQTTTADSDKADTNDKE